jgi:hypothetical protein
MRSNLVRIYYHLISDGTAMRTKIFQIDRTHAISTQYFDINFNSTSSVPIASRLLHSLATVFLLPFAQASALFTQGRHLTPGRHTSYSRFTLLDALISNSLALSYYTLGLFFSSMAVLPASLGLLFKIFSRASRKNLFQCYVSTDFIYKKSSAKNGFNLLTRNTALLPLVVTNFSNLRSSEERLPELIRSITQPRNKKTNIDILCLQEVFGFGRAKQLIDGLKKQFKYFIYDIAPSFLGLESGLFFASCWPIITARFIRPPLPTFVKANNPLGFTTSIESFTNKGILYVVIEKNGEYQVVVNAHIKSNISFDHEEAKAIEHIRAQGLRVLSHGLFDYIEEVESTLNIKINRVLLGGDLNVSDFQDNGLWNFERTGKKQGKVVREGMQDLSFLFEGIFPSPAIETWLIDDAREPNAEKTGYGQAHYNTPQKPAPHVCFDHAGVFQYRAKPCQQHQPTCDRSLIFTTTMYDDQDASNTHGSPSSDHAGILLEVKEQCRQVRQLK